MARRAKKVDDSQKEIVKALRQAGRDVFIWNDIFDLIVGFQGFTHLLDCKTIGSSHGLTESQRKWLGLWRGGAISIVYTAEEAISATSSARIHRVPELPPPTRQIYSDDNEK